MSKNVEAAESIQEIETILDEKLRPSLKPDGFGLTVESFENNRLELDLVTVSDEPCMECLLPMESLQMIVDQTFKDEMPSVQEIQINDKIRD